MAGHFSLFLSCTAYLRSITTAIRCAFISLHHRAPISASRCLRPHRLRPSPFHSIAFNRHDCVVLHCFAYSVTMSLHRIGCDHVNSSQRLRPRHFITSAVTTSLHRIGCDHVTSSHRLRPRHFIASGATTSLHRIGCDHVTSSHRVRPRHFIASGATMSLHRIGCDHVTSSHRVRPPHFIASDGTTSLHRIGWDHVTSSHRVRPHHFIASAAGMSLHRLSITLFAAAVSTSSISAVQRLPFLLDTVTSAAAYLRVTPLSHCHLALGILLICLCQSSLSHTVRTRRAGIQQVAS